MDLVVTDIPEAVDRALRLRADATGSSVRNVAVDVLSQALRVTETRTPMESSDDGLDWFFGGCFIDDSVMKAISDADVVHPDDDKILDGLK